MVKLNFNFQKKDLWLLSAIIVFLVAVGYVIAFGGTQPAVMGHSIGELETCQGEGKILKVVSGAWSCQDDNTGAGGGGDITSVVAGTGLTGGGTSGDVTLNLKNPSASEIGGVKTASCSSGQAIRQIDSSGNAVCSSIPSSTTFAVCRDGESGFGTRVCSCSGGIVISYVETPCAVTSDTGGCSARNSFDEHLGSCCVCRP